MRRIKSAIVTILTSIFIAVVIIETCLRIIAFFCSRELVMQKNVDKGPLIYCFGDSFTYGIGSENKKGYPEQLQDLCEKRYPNKNIKIINFGVPGSNSKQTLNYFRHILTSYPRPDLAILMTGMNDWWNISDNNKVLLYSKINPFIVKCCMVLTHSKIAKLLIMCFAKNTTIGTADFDSQVRVADPDGFGEQERLGSNYLSTVRVVFEENVNEFVNLARNSGIRIIFSQYPSGFIFDDSLEHISRKQKIIIIYNYINFKKFISQDQPHEYFSAEYSYSHPNTKGYAKMAEEILTALIREKQIP